MRVLILHSTYLSGAASGENRVVEDESRLLREAGHHVRVWDPAPAVSGPVGQLRAGASAVWSRSAAREVRRIVRRDAIEVVHVHNLFPMLSPAVLRSASGAGAAVVVTLHNFRLMCLPANLLRDDRVCEVCVGRSPWRGVVHRCYRGSALGSAALATSVTLHRGLGTFDSVSRFLAVSEFVRRKHLEAGVPGRQISVKANFTWPVDVRRGPGEYFLFLGRLSGEKGVDTLLGAWRRGSPGFPLVVVGDGPDGEDLRCAAPSGVEFRGQVPSGEVAGMLARARALLVPSRWYEAAPRSIIEAYAAGVPVLASDIGALPDLVVPEVSGLLVPPDEAGAWVRAVRRLTDDAESERLGRQAFELWDRLYSPARGLTGLEDAYANVLGAREVS